MSRRRPNVRVPSAFFRGKELLVLVLFTAIASIGWPILIAQLRRTHQPPPAVAKPPVDLRPIKPDDGLVFQAIRDKAPSEFRELAAYAELLARVRATSASELHAEVRRDLLYTHFWDRPSAYRGVPVRLEGTLLRTLSYDAKPDLTPKKRLYEAWFITPESRHFPYVVVFEDLPPGLTLSDNLNEPIVVEGYFFKLLGYRAGDTSRAAPMLIGRVQVTATGGGGSAGATAAATARPLWQNPAVVAVGILFLYVSFRLFFQFRRLLRPLAKPDSTVWEKEDLHNAAPPDDAEVSAFLSQLETDE